MKYALAAVLALVVGSQADAQVVRRHARSYYTPGYTQSYYTSPGYYTTPGTVVTAGFYSPSTWASGYVYPSSGYYYSTPTLGVGIGYSNYGYGNRYSGGWGRRGWRW